MRWTAPGPVFLFCPGDRPERFTKASILADVVILDLEDGVDPSRRVAARSEIREAQLDPGTTVIRINPVGSHDHLMDIEAVMSSPYRTVMLAKASDADQVRGLESFEVIALCETPRGIAQARAMAQCPNTIALMWGSEHFATSLGTLERRSSWPLVNTTWAPSMRSTSTSRTSKVNVAKLPTPPRWDSWRPPASIRRRFR
jgi:citrate lyase subunit beta/citryl-CoA lyase